MPVSGRILIVEDDDSHRLALQASLGSQYTVEAVPSAESALGNVARFQPDVVLSDVRMGEMDGFELLRHLRDRVPGTDVILMTAYEDLQGVIDAMQSGAYDYLLKPIRLDDLEARLERCFQERRKRARPVPEAEPVAISPLGLVGRHPHIVEIFKTIGQVARTRAPVLIRGETGTGKEMIARTIHANSGAPELPFVAVNCTAIPDTLLESELFGHVKGSFTGAVADRRGRFELAGAGTIFLDEIGDTDLHFQAKLLRVLQEREFYPVGSEEPRHTSARVVAATHRPIEEMVAREEFREDLYFRLRVVEITVPALRDRPGDIPLLVQSILERVATEHHRPVPTVPADVMNAIHAHAWPGNVRELENALTRAVLLAKGSVLAREHLELRERAEPGAAPRAGVRGDSSLPPAERFDSLEELEREHVTRVLLELGGNKRMAARILGVSRPRLDRIIQKHGIALPA
jgi:DNA-binding NtrC family response regulator